MKRALLFFFILALTVIGCAKRLPESQPILLSELPPPTSLSPRLADAIFRSEQFHLEVRIPSGWGIVEGPEYIAHKSIVGCVAFNSWGHPDFWVLGKTIANSVIYDSSTVMSQIPPGEAYIFLGEILGPPSAHMEYVSNNLNELLEPQDWRLRDIWDTGFHSYNFYKGGTSFILQIACSPNASEETVANINTILIAWQFDY